MYIPTHDHMKRDELRKHSLPGEFTGKNIAAALRERVQDGMQRDRDGKAALAAVVALCNDERFAGRGAWSVRARALKFLGEGWDMVRTAGGDANFRSPKGQTVYLRGSLLDVPSVLESNTCHTIGADARLAQGEAVLALVPELARSMSMLAASMGDLHAKLNGVPYIEYEPWYMVAAAVQGMG